MSCWKGEHLHIAVAVRGPFKRRVLTHYNGCLGQSSYTLQLLLGTLLKAEYLWSVSEYLIRVNKFFRKNEENLHTKRLEVGVP